ncbi:hypothetical protein CVT25_005260 [Psilocybe cyanescens]|uniref:Uncharacterized protein n=1 Tax=Psilocybe cyanescens TaxID=93625 RepID=A0A409WWV6_PSICY|nr:hypothetical protein CVT25_005260 [Psilocybe cyanescens]
MRFSIISIVASLALASQVLATPTPQDEPAVTYHCGYGTVQADIVAVVLSQSPWGGQVRDCVPPPTYHCGGPDWLGGFNNQILTLSIAIAEYPVVNMQLSSISAVIAFSIFSFAAATPTPQGSLPIFICAGPDAAFIEDNLDIHRPKWISLLRWAAEP